MRQGHCKGSGAQSPRPKHLSQIEGVDDVVPVEVGGTPLAWPPATQQNRQVKRFDLTVPVQVLRTLGVALVQERQFKGLALRPKDLDPDAGTVRVLHGEGDKARTVGMDPAAFAIVEKWMSVRKPGPHPVFCTLKGHEVKQPHICDMLRRMAKRAGITKRIHPHGLRHTFAFEMANEGYPIHVIRRQLGHSNAATTASYLDHITAGDVVAAVTGREWAA